MVGPPPRFRWLTALGGRRYIAAIAAVAALGVVPQLLSQPMPDVAWFLHVANRILDGAHPYVDVVEVNPPVILWLNLIPAALARGFGVSDVLLYRLFVFGLAVVSLTLTAGLLRSLLGVTGEPLRRSLVLLFVFTMLPLARADFGEREHWLLILTVPYVLAVAARAEGAALPRGRMLLVGAMAAVGLALKPYFLPLAIVLELYLAATCRRVDHLRRPELVVLLGGLAAYAVAVLVWVPQYIALARALGTLYYNFLRGPLWVTALFGEGAAIPLGALLAFVVLGRRSSHPRLCQVLVLAVLTLYLSAVVQAKGWRYHFYPAVGLGLVLLGAMAWDARRPLGRLVEQVYAAAAGAVVVTMMIFVVAASCRQLLRPSDPRYVADPNFSELAKLVQDRAPAGRILVLSSNMASAFPLVSATGTTWTSRFPSVWLLGALYMGELRGVAPIAYRPWAVMGPVERYLNDAMAADFARGRPDLLLVLRPGPDHREMGIRRLDYLAYFTRDPRFAHAFAEYGYLTDVDEYRVYQRGSVGAAPVPAALGDVQQDDAVAAGWDGLRGTRLDRPMLAGLVVLLPLFVGGLLRERKAA